MFNQFRVVPKRLLDDEVQVVSLWFYSDPRSLKVPERPLSLSVHRGHHKPVTIFSIQVS